MKSTHTIYIGFRFKIPVALYYKRLNCWWIDNNYVFGSGLIDKMRNSKIYGNDKMGMSKSMPVVRG